MPTKPKPNDDAGGFDPRWAAARHMAARAYARQDARLGELGEIGTPGTQISGGRIVGQEHNRNLTQAKALGRAASAGVWERMEREDPQIAGMLRSSLSVLLAAPWRVDAPDDADDAEMALADEVAADLDGLAGGLRGWLREALTFVGRGFSLSEIVLASRDGRLVWEKWAARPQRMVEGWELGEADELCAVRFDAPRQGRGSDRHEIDAHRLMLLTLGREGNNFEGVSLLRPIYTTWLLKRQILRATSIDVERTGHGYMRFRQTEREALITDDDKDAFHETALNWRTNEFAHSIEPWGVEMSIEFPDIPFEGRIGLLRYCDQQMAQAFLATFLQLGLDKAGTQALGGTLVEHFLLALRSVAAVVEDAINAPGGLTVNGPIRRIVELNHGPQKRWPRFRFGDLNPQAARDALDLVLKGLPTGAFGSWAEADAAWSREVVGAPPQTEGEGDGPEPEVDDGQADGPEALAHRPGPHEFIDAAGVRMACHRPLMPAERAVAFSEVAKALDDGVHGFRVAVEASLRTVAANVAGEARRIAENPRLDAAAKIEALAGLGLPDKPMKELRAAIRAHVAGVSSQASQSAGREVARLLRNPVLGRPSGVSSPTDISSLAGPDLDDLTDALAAVTARRMGGEIATSVVDSASRAASLGAEGAIEATRDIERAAMNRADGFYRRHASIAVAEAVTEGRRQGALDALKKLGVRSVDRVLYSSVLDGGTCGPCEGKDGAEFPLGSAEFFETRPPYQRCDGRAACRCLHIFVPG